MSVPIDTESLLEVVRKSGLIKSPKLEGHLAAMEPTTDPHLAIDTLVKAKLLTAFQGKHLLRGKYKGLILGSYKILKPIAKGGMGIVYLAEHVEMQRRVALKICMTDRVGAGAIERFQREARALATLSHPNIVQVHDVGRDGIHHFMVMEYVPGKSLEDVLRRRGRLPFREAVGYALQAAEGLRHAHERGIVHRDVKPSNLILDATGTIKLLDLGLARFCADVDDNLTERLGNGAILGSPDYIAPEQALNKFDARSDVYSLGATLHALISGDPPFPEKTTPQKLISHQLRAAPALHRLVPELPEELSAIVQKMLAKKPDDRFQNPDEVLDALSRFGPLDERRPRNRPLLWSDASVRRAGWLKAVAAGIVLMAALTAALAGRLLMQ